MKNIIRLLPPALVLGLFIGVNISVFSQPPPPSQHGVGVNQPAGNGAPIGTGIVLMTGLFAAYGAKKAWDARKKLEE